MLRWMSTLAVGAVAFAGAAFADDRPKDKPFFLMSKIDDRLLEDSEGADPNKIIEGWQRDAAYEADYIGNESFSETLQNITDFRQNYFRQVFDTYWHFPAEPGNCRTIMMSRRFAKLVEELQGESADVHTDELLRRFEADIEQFIKIRDGVLNAKGEDRETGLAQLSIRREAHRNRSPLPREFLEIKYVNGKKIGVIKSTGFFHVDDEIPAFISPGIPFEEFCYRLNAAELLIGQLVIHEGLPLVLKSVSERDGTHFVNFTSAAYACDRILSSAPTSALSASKNAIRDAYLDWKSKLAPTEYAEFFEYTSVNVPTFRSLVRPNERASILGVPVNMKEGKVSLDIPPVRWEGSFNAAEKPSMVLLQTIECARQYWLAE